MFALFTVKDGRKERKRYGALFTCLSSRAFHIEVTHSMTTDSFIMCLRSFIGRRGYVQMIRTDNGTNFVGASAELIESFQVINHVEIEEFLQQNGGEWIYWKKRPHPLPPTSKKYGRYLRGPNKNSLEHSQFLVEDTWCQAN